MGIRPNGGALVEGLQQLHTLVELGRYEFDVSSSTNSDRKKCLTTIRSYQASVTLAAYGVPSVQTSSVSITVVFRYLGAGTFSGAVVLDVFGTDRVAEVQKTSIHRYAVDTSNEIV